MGHQQVMDVVTPDGSGFLAIGVGFVAYFLVSFLWWGPLMGKKWALEMGMEMEGSGGMAKSMVLQVVASALTVYMLWMIMTAFSVTHLADGSGLVMGELAILDALTGAFFLWLGFFVPMQLGRVAWEKASWTLFGINTIGQLVALAIASVVFTFF